MALTDALISCTKSKVGGRCLAREMYWASPLFRKAYTYCKAQNRTIFILSAKYGVISPETKIKTYDETLNYQPRARLLEWASNVSRALHELIPAGSSIELHAGRNYIRYLNLSGYEVIDPLKGMTIGRRLGWYTERLRPGSTLD